MLEAVSNAAENSSNDRNKKKSMAIELHSLTVACRVARCIRYRDESQNGYLPELPMVRRR